MLYKGKESLVQLSGLLIAKGVTVAVISPGSRNAPVIAALNRRKELKCLSIVDERSAAFFALGVAQQTQKPVAICCTSGTAALNYAPAIAEAFYQQIPLIVLTADRPPEWIDQGDGQSIRQYAIYANYIRKSVQLPSEPLDNNSLHYNARLINEAIDASTFPVCGPVHINIPLSEPLYKENNTPYLATPVIGLLKISAHARHEDLAELAKQWNESKSKLIIAGLLPPDNELNTLLCQLAEDSGVAVFTETTSNLNGKHFFAQIDRIIDGIDLEQHNDFVPELLLTIGGHVISRKVKAWLQKHNPKIHWHVSHNEFHTDAFRSLSLSIPMKAKDFLGSFVSMVKPSQSHYRQLWFERQTTRNLLHRNFLKQCAWSDLKAFEIIINHLPARTMIQAGNSTPVRYLQLFDRPEETTFFGNRGVSGIDGCTSTAAGAAWANKALTVLITGDVAFLYDSNALWNRHLAANLRIIVMNNGGGNIFRIIEGPDTLPELETFIETPYIPPLQYMANMYGLDYYAAADESGLRACLTVFLDKTIEKPAVLEVKTPNKTSAAVLKEYFKFLRS